MGGEGSDASGPAPPVRRDSLSLNGSPPSTPPDDGPSIPASLLAGMRLEKVDRSGSTLSRFVQLDARRGVVVVETKKGLLRGISNKEGVKYIEVKNLKEVRAGLNTKELTQVPRSAGELEDRAFSVIYTRRGQYKSLNLIAPSADIARLWVGTLLVLWNRLGRDQHKEKDGFLKGMWNAADLDKDGKVTSTELARLFAKFNIARTKPDVNDIFRTLGWTNDRRLDFEDFRRLYSAIEKRPDIDRLFQLATEKGTHINLEHWKNFLTDTQKQTLTDEEVASSYSTWADSSDGVSRDSFGNYLLSTSGSVFNQDNLPIFQDMSRPLHEYWISSSHNTYLLGDQLRSNSSVEAYIRALQAGCRCVEIDTWDGPAGQPVVTHGRTLTSKIPLKEVLQAIAKYGFVASEYPIILSFEQHCSLEQQRVIALMLRDVFGASLITEPVGEGPIPSLDQLKGRVILKHKRMSVNSRTVPGARSSRSLSPSGRTPELAPSPPPELESNSTLPDFSLLDLMSESESESEMPAEEVVLHAGKRKKLRPTARELSVLSIYFVPNYLPPLPAQLSDARPECVTALSENTAFKLAREQWPAFAAWNMGQCTRVYPRQLRIDSSNFDPQVVWDVGVAMVALNWQTRDAAMQRNRALFHANGNSGYVLKPAYLRLPPPENLLPTPPSRTWRLKIRLISGQHLPRPSDDPASPSPSPYVAIDLCASNVRLLSQSTPRPTPLGQSTDDDGDDPLLSLSTYYSRAVQGNGFDPNWDEVCSFVFQRPETAFLRFRVSHADPRGLDTVLGCYTIHIPNMMQGYRHIPLEAESGEPVPFASLFAKLRLKPYVN